MVAPTRSDFSRIAVINLILRNARCHLRDEYPVTSKSVRLSAAAAIAAKCARRRHMQRSKDRRYSPSSYLAARGTRHCLVSRRGMSLRIAKLELCAMGTLMEPEAHLAWMRHWRRVKAEEIAAAVKAGWFSGLRADYVKAVSCKLSTRSRSRAVPS